MQKPPYKDNPNEQLCLASNRPASFMLAITSWYSLGSFASGRSAETLQIMCMKSMRQATESGLDILRPFRYPARPDMDLLLHSVFWLRIQACDGHTKSRNNNQ
jgi:hypothetical protein